MLAVSFRFQPKMSSLIVQQVISPGELVNHDYQADVKVFIVSHDYQATIKILRKNFWTPRFWTLSGPNLALKVSAKSFNNLCMDAD